MASHDAIYVCTTMHGSSAISSKPNTRLTISGSEDTDRDPRAHHGAQGLKKGALSAFIADAVRWRLFDQTVETIKSRNAATPPEELQALIDATFADVRANRRAWETLTPCGSFSIPIS